MMINGHTDLQFPPPPPPPPTFFLSKTRPDPGWREPGLFYCYFLECVVVDGRADVVVLHEAFLEPALC